MKLSIAKTFTTILRGITLSSKFILTIGLAKFLTPEEFGLYGLFFATIVFCMMVVGFDFYCYSTREIIVSPRYHWVVLIRNQAAFCMVSYFLILPACSILFATGLLPWSLAGWFLVLLALEYAAQEANRLLVAMSEQVLASIVLFIRQGLWALVAFSCMCLNSDARNLTFVFYIWATGVFASFVLASIHIQSFRIFHVSSPIDWIWIKRGLSISLPFFIGTISMQAIYTIDRYLIERICGLDALAAYVFFMSIANAIFSFLDASVFSFSYPKLISTGNSLSEASFLKEVKSLAFHTVVLSIGLSAVVLVFIWPVLDFLQKPVYLNNISFLYLLILATVFLSFSMVPHYALIARHKDRSIFLSHILSLPIFVIAAISLYPVLHASAVPAGLALSFLFLFLFKSFVFCSNLPTALFKPRS